MKYCAILLAILALAFGSEIPKDEAELHLQQLQQQQTRGPIRLDPSKAPMQMRKKNCPTVTLTTAVTETATVTVVANAETTAVPTAQTTAVPTAQTTAVPTAQTTAVPTTAQTIAVPMTAVPTFYRANGITEAIKPTATEEAMSRPTATVRYQDMEASVQ